MTFQLGDLVRIIAEPQQSDVPNLWRIIARSEKASPYNWWCLRVSAPYNTWVPFREDEMEFISRPSETEKILWGLD